MQVPISQRPLFCILYSDPCDPNPCFQGRKCTAKPGGDYECEPCPEGYTGDGEKCDNIDECKDENICGAGGKCEDTAVCVAYVHVMNCHD